jgi:hypothetical protein
MKLDEAFLGSGGTHRIRAIGERVAKMTDWIKFFAMFWRRPPCRRLRHVAGRQIPMPANIGTHLLERTQGLGGKM